MKLISLAFVAGFLSSSLPTLSASPSPFHFTDPQQDSSAKRYAAELAEIAAAMKEEGHLRIVATLRDDFIQSGKLPDFSALAFSEFKPYTFSIFISTVKFKEAIRSKANQELGQLNDQMRQAIINSDKGIQNTLLERKKLLMPYIALSLYERITPGSETTQKGYFRVNRRSDSYTLARDVTKPFSLKILSKSDGNVIVRVVDIEANVSYDQEIYFGHSTNEITFKRADQSQNLQLSSMKLDIDTDSTDILAGLKGVTVNMTYDESKRATFVW